MTDHTAGGGHGTSSHQHHHHPARTPRAEYYTYFPLIFLFAVPIAVLVWLWEVLRDRRLPVHGPLGEQPLWAGLARLCLCYVKPIHESPMHSGTN